MQVFLNECAGAVLQLLLFSLLPFLWWLLAGRKQTCFFPWLGLKKPVFNGKPVATLLLTLAAAAVYALGTSAAVSGLGDGITTAGSSFAGMGISALPAALVYGFIRTGLSEEIIFRGFLLKRVAARFGFIAGNTVQALCFGLLHGLPFGLVTGSVPVAFLLTLLPGAFGWYQGWLNEKRCGGSILPSWLLHGIMNSLIACLSL